jgi:hypothetical protein
MTHYVSNESAYWTENYFYRAELLLRGRLPLCVQSQSALRDFIAVRSHSKNAHQATLEAALIIFCTKEFRNKMFVCMDFMKKVAFLNL